MTCKQCARAATGMWHGIGPDRGDCGMSLHSVVFEDARLRKWFGSKGREALQGAGSIKRECQLWAEWLAAVGCSYRAVSPHSKGPKLDAAQFARLTGWPGRTNEHGRDAAMLVFGRIA